MSILNITNGDAAADLLRAADIAGEIVVWRDVLHEGPVPADLDAAALRECRARFLAGNDWTTQDNALRLMRERDEQLQRFSGSQIVLFFEHDLYDQLQVLQVLDALVNVNAGINSIRIEMVSVDAYIGRPGFHGLGNLGPEEVRDLERFDVTGEHLALGRDGWAAFRAPDPTTLLAFLERDLGALPYLRAALLRLLGEYPNTAGLSKTEELALQGVAAGITSNAGLFRYVQDNEEAPFLGDTIFFATLERLARGPRPLLNRQDDRQDDLSLTDDGRLVLAGNKDFLAWNGIDRWIGGVHLRAGNVWRRDTDLQLQKSQLQ